MNEKKIIYVVTIILSNGSVIQEESNEIPTLENVYITNDGNFIRFKTINEINSIVDSNYIKTYIVCLEKEQFKEQNLIGIKQCKIFPLEIDPLLNIDLELHEKKVNKFIYDNRFKYEITNISYTTEYISVEYVVLNEKDREHKEFNLKAYQNNSFRKFNR